MVLKKVNKYLGVGVCQGQKGLMEKKKSQNKNLILHYIDAVID